MADDIGIGVGASADEWKLPRNKKMTESDLCDSERTGHPNGEI